MCVDAGEQSPYCTRTRPSDCLCFQFTPVTDRPTHRSRLADYVNEEKTASMSNFLFFSNPKSKHEMPGFLNE